jgi:hypothetical protein
LTSSIENNNFSGFKFWILVLWLISFFYFIIKNV